jgi:chromosome segregation ATPase
MHLTHLNQALAEISEERARIQDEKAVLADKLADLDRSLHSLSKAEAGLREVLGTPKLNLPAEPAEPGEGEELVFPPEPASPRTREAAYDVLREHEGHRLTVRNIERKLREAGMLNPELKQPYGTIQEACRRLAKSKPEIVRIKRNGNVYYAYRSQNLPTGKE